MAQIITLSVLIDPAEEYLSDKTSLKGVLQYLTAAAENNESLIVDYSKRVETTIPELDDSICNGTYSRADFLRMWTASKWEDGKELYYVRLFHWSEDRSKAQPFPPLLSKKKMLEKEDGNSKITFFLA